MSTRNSNGIEAHYTESGEGVPVVLVHGGGTTSRYWDGVCAALPSGIRTIAPDLFGCGATPPWTGAGTLTHDIEALLVRAAIDIAAEPVHLIGHSYGAAACLRAALSDQAKIRSMVLIEPPIYQLLRQTGHHELYDEISAFRADFERLAAKGNAAAAMELLVDRFGGPGSWAQLPDKARHSLLGLIDGLIIGFAANADNPTKIEQCQTLEIPTLLPWGDKTGEPERAMVEILAEALPLARSTAIPGARHQSPLTHPKAVAALVESHLLHT